MGSVVSDSMRELLETAAEMSELRGRDWSREDRVDDDRSDRRFDDRYGDFRIAAEADEAEQIKQLQLQQQIRQQQMGRQTRPQSVLEEQMFMLGQCRPSLSPFQQKTGNFESERR
jgi:hypothetical protein